jgi:hypothetical protein
MATNPTIIIAENKKAPNTVPRRNSLLRRMKLSTIVHCSDCNKNFYKRFYKLTNYLLLNKDVYGASSFNQST